MGIRCSLLGCDYGDSEIEREREERGSEVVMTVREYEECARCGDKRVISENTGVTSLAAADGPGPTVDATGAGDPPDESEGASPATGEASASASDPDPEPDAADEGVETAEVPGDAGDAEILDEDATDPSVDADDADPVTADADDADPVTAEADGTDPVDAEADEDLESVDPDDSAQILGEGDASSPTAEAESDPTSQGEGEATPAESEDPADAVGDWPEHDIDADDGGEGGDVEYPDDDAIILDDTADRTFDSHTGERPGQAEARGETADWPDHDARDASQGGAGEATVEDAFDADDGDAETDDAVIMGDDDVDDAADDRARGDWPDHDGGSGPSGDYEAWPDVDDRAEADAASADHGDWPDQDGEDEGWDATTDGADADVEFSGLTPEASTGGDVGGGSAARASSSARARSNGHEAPSTGGGSRGTAATDGESLTCSTCDNAVSVDGSPHAAGDICPECARGYLTEE